MSRKAVLYARVSTDDQADKGYSLPSQLELCRRYAERLGFEVITELREDYSGAIAIAERPTGKQLAAMVKARTVDVVIVYQVDRLSRDIVDLLATVRLWIKYGIELHTCDIGKIESELDIVLVIKGWQGSDERKKIRERSMRGRRAKAQSGRVVVCGRAPYGYAFLRDEKGSVVSFEIVEEEAQVVRLIFKWYLHGDENGTPLSAMGIAKRLSEMRAPTPGELRSGYHRKRSAGMWGACKVLEIISHEVYAGHWRFGGRIGNSRIMRPMEERITVNVPPILDRATWDRAQAQRNRNKIMSKRNAKHAYLLSGLIKCDCGAAFCGNCFSGHRYYTCSWRHNHHTTLETRTCHERSVRADAIEEDVWEGLKGLFADIEGMEQKLRMAQQSEMDALEPKRLELEAVEANVLHTDREADDLAETMLVAKDRIKKSLEVKQDEINARYAALVKRRDELLADLAARRLTDEAIHDVLTYAHDVRAGMENPTFSDKRRNLETLRVEVMIKNGRYFAKCLIGDWDNPVRKIKRGGKVGIVTSSRLPDTGLL